MSERKVPKLRFAGFTDDWKQRKLGEIGELSAGRDIRKEKLVPNGKYPVLANALTNKGIVGYYDDYEYEAPAVTITGRGDVGVAVARDVNFSAVVRLLVLHRIKDYDIKFLECAINLNTIFVESTGVPQLTAPQFSKYEIYCPTLPEQQAIGEFFRRLDETIAFHQREWEKYKNLKISYLEKMFPQKNEDKPQLRFPNFTDAWKQRKLGEVLFIRSEFESQSHFQIDIELENLEPETGRLIGDLSIRTQTNSVFRKGDVLFGRLRPYLKKWHLAQTDGLKSGEIWAFHTTDEFHQAFIYLIVQSENFLNYTNIATGTKMPRADWNLISQMPIFIPSLPEQQAIGEFFRRLDDTIAFHQRELEKYRRLKQVFLDRLFV